MTNQKISLFANLKRLFSHLSRRRRWQLVALVIFLLVGAVAEMATIGAVVPFLALLADQTLAHNYPTMLTIFGLLGWKGGEGVLFYASILFAVVAICGAVVRIILSWASFKLTFALGADIGGEVYRRSLYQPYSFHVARNTSEIIAGLNKAQIVIGGVINPLMQGMVALVIALAILAVLIHIDMFTAMAAIAGFTAMYVATTLLTRSKLQINGRIIAENETRRVQAAQEGLGGIRDVIIDSAQHIYINRFNKFNIEQRRAQAANYFVAGAPRYFIESIGMVLIAALAFWLGKREGGLSTAIPVLGALALGAQKLLPQMQLLYFGWVTISGHRVVLADVIDLLEQPIPVEYLHAQDAEALHLTSQIALRDVSFRYNVKLPEVIHNITLEIPRGSRIGFIGKTGSGKSTLIDLVMGLLEPTSGHIEIDGQPLTSQNRRAWQARIAHVPQSIYLADSAIEENIAFGIDPACIDYERMRAAASKAELAEYIESLPLQYRTPVGERGVRLSGGQRQRIGIARALYKRAEVLVLDEATSALDDATEESVMQAINALGRDITILMIAHRVSTLSSCDRIIEVIGGGINELTGARNGWGRIVHLPISGDR